MQVKILKRVLNFARPAKTSRDSLNEREVYYFILREEAHGSIGIGECAPIFGLSRENRLSFGKALDKVQSASSLDDIPEDLLVQNPSIRFALETAVKDMLSGGKREIFPLSKKPRIPINGLVWMNEKDAMRQEAFEKVEAGYSCIKLKIGGINFSDELEILSQLRNTYDAKHLEIRLDANGAFSPENVMYKLEALSRFTIHSIEQPIKAGQWNAMRELCNNSPIPIALDEELIGIDGERKKEVLDTVQPHYIILKPTLHGGFSGSDDWINLARERKIDWWATSALESNIGLNAIAQWVSTYQNPLHQGLGTGKLFVNNIPSPLQSGDGYFWWNEKLKWQIDFIMNEFNDIVS